MPIMPRIAIETRIFLFIVLLHSLRTKSVFQGDFTRWKSGDFRGIAKNRLPVADREMIGNRIPNTGMIPAKNRNGRARSSIGRTALLHHPCRRGWVVIAARIADTARNGKADNSNGDDYEYVFLHHGLGSVAAKACAQRCLSVRDNDMRKNIDLNVWRDFEGRAAF